MATLSPSRPCCPIRVVSVHLLSAAGDLLRVLFLDREGHITSQPHYVSREEALILASNQQIVLGPQAAVRVLWGPGGSGPGALPRGSGPRRSDSRRDAQSAQRQAAAQGDIEN